jgi:prephenate dehydratase
MDIKIAYIGGKHPSYSWSELAAETWAKRKGFTLIPKPVDMIDEIIPLVINGAADLGMMPCDQLLEGRVEKSWGLIFDNDIRIASSQRVPIIWAVGAYPESEDRSVVYSHPKGLGQCSGWIMENRFRTESTSSTSAAAVKVANEKKGLAIARVEALKDQGLEIIYERGIGNVMEDPKGVGAVIENVTDFYLVSANGYKEKMEPGKGYLTLVAISPHEDDKPGLLEGILEVIKGNGINNTDIHSSPVRGRIRPGNPMLPVGNIKKGNGKMPKMFYIEMECHADSSNFVNCVGELDVIFDPHDSDVEVVKVMGSYEAPWLTEI